VNSWRDTILNEFVPKISRLTIVSDPDALLTEEKLTITLRKRGFDLIEFNDAIEFRYAYESNYRSIWDQGKHTDLVIVLRLHDTDVDSLPFDLLNTGRRLSFDLGSLFPNLSYPVLEKIDRSLLDVLFEAQQNYSPGRIGDNATKDFILSHVFGIAAELIKSDIELLRTLLRIHYNSLNIPGELTDRLIQVLSGHKAFAGWPLADVIPDGNAFFEFLQERWLIFLSDQNTNDKVKEVSEGYGLKHHGPDSLPFGHQDIRVYIDNLFVESKLSPVNADTIGFDINTLQDDTWIKCGIANLENNEEVRIARLLDLIKEKKPTEDSRYSDWTSLAIKWAELAALVHNDLANKHRDRFHKLGDSLNKVFTTWLNNHYAGLISLPPTNPVMLHHVSRKMARELEDSQCAGVALLVLDGLAFDQWITLKQVLQEQMNDIIFRETAIFAWVPTLTSVSRQSIFAGKEPLYFPDSINTTNKESLMWRQFWENHGFSRLDITYQRGLSDGDPISDLEPIFNPGKTKAIGLIVDKVDKIMHGMQLGAAGMHNQIRQWSKQGYLSALIKYLLDLDYHIWLTSDHGNIECNGKGRPSEGSIAETCGERARVYPAPELRSKVLSDHISAKEWQSPGLPSEYYPLVAEGRDAFIRKGKRIVGHGGISIEEVIVPLVKIERRTR